MKEILIFARAGQGAITSAIILATAAVEEGKHAFAFPHFGSERMGAPLNAYVRLDDKPIRTRSQIREPDYVLVQDPTLLAGFDVAAGLKPGGVVVINSPHPAHALGLRVERGRVVTVPASHIAQEVLGRADRANTPLLGAFAAATGEVGMEALKTAVRRRFPGRAGEDNTVALQRGYDFIMAHREVAS